ncbi:MAG: hypothetical protein WDW38_005448 [Sanguina aurantia]
MEPLQSISVSWPSIRPMAFLPVAVILASCSLSLLVPGSAQASEVLSGGALVIMQDFLEYVQSLGAWGGVALVVTIMFAEMIPLFPTQPLSLAGGLLFGPQKGALLVLIGVTLAATNAFMLSRGVGRKLAQRMLAAEIGEAGAGAAAAAAATPSPPSSRSASNYLLGLTPVQVPAFMLGTLAGMTPWSIAYASLGGASRSLLDGGMDLGTLLTELSERSGSYTKSALVLAGAVAVVAAIYFSIRSVQAAKTTDQASSRVPDTQAAITASVAPLRGVRTDDVLDARLEPGTHQEGVARSPCCALTQLCTGESGICL